MADIKVKNRVEKTIKVFDKSFHAFDKTKDNIINSYSEEDINQFDYGSKKIKQNTENAINKSIDMGNKNLIRTKNKLKNIKTKTKGIKNKTAKRINKIKQSFNKTKKTTKVSKKTAKTTVNMTKKVLERTGKTIATTSKTIIKIIKGIVVVLTNLISAIIAGGWIAVLIIVILCVIAFLITSIYGIFFSSEDKDSELSISKTIIELNNELSDKIENIKKESGKENYEINFDRTEWKYILTVFVAKTSNGNNEMEFFTMDEKKKKSLKEVFWDMTSVDSSIENDTLHIFVKGKTINEMIIKYNFNKEQKEQVNELLSDDFKDLWQSAIYGISIGNTDIVQLALSQVGNVGGEIYWRWYGFTERAEWCAIFVSWLANEMGYIESGIIPKFSVCLNGVNWFKEKGLWKDKDYIPNPGDIIFFDWEVDGQVNHVGIVEKVENNTIYTIEGNSLNDTCRERKYAIGSNIIFGYGTPKYL